MKPSTFLRLPPSLLERHRVRSVRYHYGTFWRTCHDLLAPIPQSQIILNSTYILQFRFILLSFRWASASPCLAAFLNQDNASE